MRRKSKIEILDDNHQVTTQTSSADLASSTTSSTDGAGEARRLVYKLARVSLLVGLTAGLVGWTQLPQEARQNFLAGLGIHSDK
jgi:hypothetical protein